MDDRLDDVSPSRPRAAGAAAGASSTRHPTLTEMLSTDTLRWLFDLPRQVQPQRLPVDYPRITNTLAQRWKSPREFLAYLDDLLLDRRCTRAGFSLEVAFELAVLKNYYETVVFPTQQTAWDQVIHRRFGT